jgi:hypothetical protein
VSTLWLAISLTVLIGFAGVGADTGLVWITRSVLQNSVDAAALAAAQDLAPTAPDGGEDAATDRGCVYATQRNAVPGMMGIDGSDGCDGADVAIDDAKITVTAYRQVQPVFGAVLGWDPIEVSASASARVGSIEEATCLFPFFQTPTSLAGVWQAGSGIKFDPPVPTILKNGASGDPLTFDQPDEHGASKIYEHISSPDKCDADGQLSIDDVINIDPGNMSSLMKAFGERDQLVQDQGTCVPTAPTDPAYTIHPDGTVWKGSLELTPKNCYRMALLPITTDPTKKDAKIQAFAVFWIGGYCKSNGKNGTCSSTPPPELHIDKTKSVVWGYYVGLSAPGGTDYRDYDGYGTKVVGLVP